MEEAREGPVTWLWRQTGTLDLILILREIKTSNLDSNTPVVHQKQQAELFKYSEPARSQKTKICLFFFVFSEMLLAFLKRPSSVRFRIFLYEAQAFRAWSFSLEYLQQTELLGQRRAADNASRCVRE